MKVVKDHTTLERPTVLYVDPDQTNRQAFLDAFRTEYDVLLATDLEGALEHLERGEVHVAICDQRLPGVCGSLALRQIRSRFPRVRRMLVTAHADLQSIMDALNYGGACFYINEPWEVSTVRAAVTQAVAEIREELERAAFTERLVEANQQLEFALRQSLLA